ncbi:MAG: FKBP-type peptidyl-prolyl cis-trans isomerase [Pseudomonadales bacterium]|nr:FKBP-type peptidyl-prolyl cis-trans isomerase [Pseudomonadales bacterium]
MKKTLVAIAVITTALGLQSCKENTAPSTSTDTVATVSPAAAPAKSSADDIDLSTEKNRLSYILGLEVGGQFANQNIEIDVDYVAAGMRDAFSGKEPRLSEEEMQKTAMAFQKQMMEKQQKMQAEMEAQRLAQGEVNKMEGEKFLAENAVKEGVNTTESGLQYKIITEGSGPKPSAEDVVTVHYVGKLINGTVFDSSIERGEPATFALNQVIPGWTEALQLMPEGSKWEIYLPSDLAYGPGGAGRDIGPNSTLIFEVELLKASQDEEEQVNE